LTDKTEVKKILIISSDKNLREVLKFCFAGWGYDVMLYESSPTDINSIKKTSPDVIVVDVHGAKRTDLEICRLLKDDFITAFIPVVTLINKRQLRSQLLNIKQGVDDYLIKPPDPLDLRVRVEMAMKRSQYSFYASPLTGLPGGRVIEEMLRERFKNDLPFSFGYLDLDNFKYFNDTYGYVKVDRVIMQTAYMLYATISKLGNKDDFIGHIGGDDFAFITTPDKYIDICRYFITEFNKIMPFHYSAADRARGYVVARDRTHKIKNIPLMSVSVAVVNRGKDSEYKNLIEINEKVAEVKSYLKSFEGSKFMADRRSDPKGSKAEERQMPHIYPAPKVRDGRAFRRNAQTYKPLGQILLERGKLSGEQLDEALRTHWRRGIRLGDIIRELGLVGEKDLTSALKESGAAHAT
jgi:diguanylate cyclase (GGDEF)-like protein